MKLQDMKNIILAKEQERTEFYS